jgi:endonuclease G
MNKKIKKKKDSRLHESYNKNGWRIYQLGIRLRKKIIRKDKPVNKAITFIYLFLIINTLGSQQLEIPEITKPKYIVTREYYTLQYNDQHEQADWVAYELTKREVQGREERNNYFSIDPLVRGASANNDDYYKSGYDRGHLAPAADMKITRRAMRDSFFYSNISPQKHTFNAGIWLKLEKLVRQWATIYESIYVVTGPVLSIDPIDHIGENKVSVPGAFYKVILDFREPEYKAIGFIIPHNNQSDDLWDYAYSVDDVEAMTGINFFNLLPDEIEHRLERYCSLSSWTLDPVIEKSPPPPNHSNTQASYWINDASGTRHNPTCRYYGKTKTGHYTAEPEGEPCGYCGG